MSFLLGIFNYLYNKLECNQYCNVSGQNWRAGGRTWGWEECKIKGIGYMDILIANFYFTFTNINT